jgi:hypothetical protein
VRARDEASASMFVHLRLQCHTCAADAEIDSVPNQGVERLKHLLHAPWDDGEEPQFL